MILEDLYNSKSDKHSAYEVWQQAITKVQA